MIRVGLVGCDTSHVVQFTMRFNHLEIAEEQWVDGARVVAAWPGTSLVTAQDVIDNYVSKITAMGVEIVDELEDLLPKIDCVMVEANDGSMHLSWARPFIEAGMTTYIDKPFASSYADALKLVELGEKHNVGLFSSSSLRYGPEVQDFIANLDSVGAILGASAWTPASLHPRNPGLYHYGVHGVEILYTLMGTGCDSVSCTFEEDAEVTVGHWSDGRIGTLRGIRRGSAAFGFVAWCENAVEYRPVSAEFIYRELLKNVVTFFETGKSPVCIHETLEIMGFMEAALVSAQAGGKRTELPGK